MSVRKRPDSRCARCEMRHDRCICERAARCKQTLGTTTHVRILMHHRERFLTSNTARLAALCLPNCEIHIRGLIDQPLRSENILSDERQPLLLYPSPDARDLTTELLAEFERPLTLIVPDGSWRQASKVPKREPFLARVPRVKLPYTRLSQYRLRREPKPEGLATFEAIIRALGIIEGFRLNETLEPLFLTMVSNIMEARGYT